MNFHLISFEIIFMYILCWYFHFRMNFAIWSTNRLHTYMEVLRHHFNINNNRKMRNTYRISHIFITLHLLFLFTLFVCFFSLAFSVTLFCSEAVIAIIILLVRRNKTIGSGGELGGSFMSKAISGSLLFSLWIIYLVMSSLEAYGVITGF